MTTKKNSTPQTNTRKTALRLFNLLHDERVPKDARRTLMEWTDDIANDSPLTDPAQNRNLFLRAFVDGWQRPDSAHARTVMCEILSRLDASESLESIFADFDRERVEWARKAKEEERRKPEPEDKLSDAWRYWTLRKFEDAFNGDDRAAYTAAWREFKTLLNGLTSDGNFYYTSFALALLPQLIICRQEIDKLTRRDRKSKAGMKAAATR
jgi:uncharacterized protein (UPF0147 family)